MKGNILLVVGAFFDLQRGESACIHSLTLFLLVIMNIFLQFFFSDFFSGSNDRPFYLGKALKALSQFFSFTVLDPIMSVKRREQKGKRCLEVLFKIM